MKDIPTCWTGPETKAARYQKRRQAAPLPLHHGTVPLGGRNFICTQCNARLEPGDPIQHMWTGTRMLCTNTSRFEEE